MISIENNGKKLPELPIDPNNGIGIVNIKERLNALYEDNYSFTMGNSNTGVKTEVLVPNS